MTTNEQVKRPFPSNFRLQQQTFCDGAVEAPYKIGIDVMANFYAFET